MCQQNGRSWLFRQKKLGPTLGAVYRKWKIKNHVQDPKIDQRSVNNSKKGYKRNTHNQNHPQNNLYWEWKKMVRIHYYGVLDKICVLNPKTVITFARIPVSYQIDSGSACSILPVNVYEDISGVYNLNANKPALSLYDEETINLDTGNQKSLC